MRHGGCVSSKNRIKVEDDYLLAGRRRFPDLLPSGHIEIDVVDDGKRDSGEE